MQRKDISCLLLTALLVSVLAIPISVLAPNGTETWTYDCIKDAYVDESRPTENFNETVLAVNSTGGDPPANKRSYLAFDFTNITSDVNILSATLKVYVLDPPSMSRRYQVCVIHSSWDETSITWNNRPREGWSPDTKTVWTTGWVEFNVSWVIRGYAYWRWNVEYGFMIRDESEYQWPSTETLFASSEHENPALRPQLVVEIGKEPDFMLTVWGERQITYPGGSVDYGFELRSLNGYGGTITMSLTELPEGASYTIEPDTPISLSAGECRGGRIRVTTSGATPEGTYIMTVTATDGTLTHTYNVWLHVRLILIFRDLPPYAYNSNDRVDGAWVPVDTDALGNPVTSFPVTLTYDGTGIIDAIGLIITEHFDRDLVFVNYTFSSFFPFEACVNRTYEGSHREVKWVIASETPIPPFNLTYFVYYNYTRDPNQMPGEIGVWGPGYTAINATGNTRSDPVLGDGRLRIERGLPWQWDDDGRVDDWELLEVINAWVRDELTDEELLEYIALWIKSY